MFGFVFLAFIVLLVVCAETSILLCYFHLCAEDYRWWWRSFFSTGTTALFLLLFCLHYFFFKTSITGGLSYLIYFTYTSIIVFLFFIFTGKNPLSFILQLSFTTRRTGTIGFIACSWFVWKIYSIVKID